MNHDAAGARPEEDDALIRRIAAGDSRALGALWDRHGATAFALACAVTTSPPVAESVVADAFAHVWREASSFASHRMSVFAWLTSIVRTHALRVKARDAEVPRVLVRETSARDERRGTAREPGAAVTGSGALDALQARAVELAFFGGLTKARIAAELQLTEAAVALLLRSAVETIGSAGGRASDRASAATALSTSLAPGGR